MTALGKAELMLHPKVSNLENMKSWTVLGKWRREKKQKHQLTGVCENKWDPEALVQPTDVGRNQGQTKSISGEPC